MNNKYISLLFVEKKSYFYFVFVQNLKNFPMILFFLLYRHYIYQPWFLSNGPSSKFLCRGWYCGSSKDNVTEREYFYKVIKKFKEEKLKTSLFTALEKLTSINYLPAVCASGLFYLFNYDGFNYDVQKSYNILAKCANQGFWACHEHLAFHPLTNDNERWIHINISAKLGSVNCMKKLASEYIKKEEYEKANQILHPLLIAMSSNWLQKRRTGPAYAKDVKSILLNDRHVSLSWKDLFKKAKNGNLAAGIWIADGFLNGKFTNTTSKEIAMMMDNFTNNGLWNFDVTYLLETDDSFNKKEIVKYLSRLGDQAAQALDSYSEFFEN